MNMTFIRISKQAKEVFLDIARQKNIDIAEYFEALAKSEQEKMSNDFADKFINMTKGVKRKLVEGINFRLLSVPVTEQNTSNISQIVGDMFENLTVKHWFLDVLGGLSLNIFSARGSKYSIKYEDCTKVMCWAEKIKIPSQSRILKDVK